jgi:hypothetical protein
MTAREAQDEESGFAIPHTLSLSSMAIWADG